MSISLVLLAAAVVFFIVEIVKSKARSMTAWGLACLTLSILVARIDLHR